MRKTLVALVLAILTTWGIVSINNTLCTRQAQQWDIVSYHEALAVEAMQDASRANIKAHHAWKAWEQVMEQDTGSPAERAQWEAWEKASDAGWVATHTGDWSKADRLYKTHLRLKARWEATALHKRELELRKIQEETGRLTNDLTLEATRLKEEADSKYFWVAMGMEIDPPTAE